MANLPQRPRTTLPTTRARGNAAESLAALHLRLRGYAIVERNFLCRGGEIDIVARQGGVLVFVEVRSRADASFLDPVASVNAAKLRHLVRAAQTYLLARGVPPSTPCRFDIVGVTGRGTGVKVALVRNAFTLDDLPPRRRR